MTTSDLTESERECLEHYASYKTDASPVTKAIRKLLAAHDKLHALRGAGLDREHIAEWKHATGCQTPSDAKAHIAALTLRLGEVENLLRRADVYVVAHIVSAKGALEEEQEERASSRDDKGCDDLRELVDDINEATALRTEMIAALAQGERA